MEEEIILKRAMFGGYRKEDVLRYIDSILDQNEQRVDQLFEQLDDLEEENKLLKTKLKEKEQDGSLDHIFLENDLIQFPTSLKEIDENETLSFMKEEMEIPEGNYFVDEDKNVHILQTPNPEFPTKKTEPKRKSEKTFEEKAMVQQDTVQKDSSQISKVALAVGKNPLLKQRKMKDVSECPNELNVDEPLEQKKSMQMEDELYFIEEIRQLKEQIESLKEELLQEKNTKLELAHKLEYSSDLMVKLYQANK